MSNVFKQFDTVRLLVEVPNPDGIRPGMVGAIIDFYNYPYPAIAVEFSHEVGHLAILVLHSEQIEPA
jgi:hypothetical protein